jgi:hypothetical protein
MAAEEIARQLEDILDSYNKRVEEQKAKASIEKEEEKESFLAHFERIKVEIIKPAMEEIGKYLETKGQQYQIKDEWSPFYGNPKITFEVLPRTLASGYEVYETPSISFIGDKIAMVIGIQKKNGMPGQATGNISTKGMKLEEVTADFVRGEIIELIKENFR